MPYPSLIKYLIIGRISDRRSIYTNPTLREAAARPVKEKASGMLVFFGSIGWNSKTGGNTFWGNIPFLLLILHNSFMFELNMGNYINLQYGALFRYYQ